MKLHALYCGCERANMAIFDPFDANVGTKIEIPYFAYLIEHDKGNVLFDTGAHPSLAVDPAARLGPAAEAFEVRMKPGEDVVGALRSLGFAPSDITHVVQSHLHYDHAGGIEFFPHAEFFVQRTELPFAHWPPVYQRDMYVRADFDHPVRWVELRGSHDVFGDERVVIFPTPGHTPGHQSLLVHLDKQSIILGGDAAYLPQKMHDRCLPGILWNPDALVESWERIEELQAKHGARLILTHDLDLAAVRVAPKSFYE